MTSIDPSQPIQPATVPAASVLFVTRTGQTPAQLPAWRARLAASELPAAWLEVGPGPGCPQAMAQIATDDAEFSQRLLAIYIELLRPALIHLSLAEKQLAALDLQSLGQLVLENFGALPFETLARSKALLLPGQLTDFELLWRHPALELLVTDQATLYCDSAPAMAFQGFDPDRLEKLDRALAGSDSPYLLSHLPVPAEAPPIEAINPQRLLLTLIDPVSAKARELLTLVLRYLNHPDLSLLIVVRGCTAEAAADLLEPVFATTDPQLDILLYEEADIAAGWQPLITASAVLLLADVPELALFGAGQARPVVNLLPEASGWPESQLETSSALMQQISAAFPAARQLRPDLDQAAKDHRVALLARYTALGATP